MRRKGSFQFNEFCLLDCLRKLFFVIITHNTINFLYGVFSVFSKEWISKLIINFVEDINKFLLSICVHVVIDFFLDLLYNVICQCSNNFIWILICTTPCNFHFHFFDAISLDFLSSSLDFVPYRFICVIVLLGRVSHLYLFNSFY